MRLVLGFLIFALSTGALASETETPTGVSGAAPATSPAPAASPVSPIAVKKLSPTRYRITRAGVDQALVTLPDVLAQARAVPNFEQGQPVGYKLFQIVPGSFISNLGLRDGDVIVKINGQAMNDPGQAMAVITNARATKKFVLDLKRAGRRLKYNYEIAPGSK